jgi:hypothetical protein
MASSTRKWLVGCGIGCGGAIVLSIVAPLLFGLVMMRPLNKAIEVQDQLAAEMGARDAFSPPAGVVAPGTPRGLPGGAAGRDADVSEVHEVRRGPGAHGRPGQAK